MRKWVRLPSPAMIVAMLALLVALSGTVYAASKINGSDIKKNSMPGDRIKKQSLPGNRLKKNTVTGTQIKESTLAQVPSAVTANTANPAAYAHILGAGTVDPTDSFNLTSANVLNPEKGVFCLSGLAFTPHAAMAEVDSGDGPGVTETSVVPANFVGCPPTAQVEVVTYEPKLTEFQNFKAGLYVVIF